MQSQLTFESSVPHFRPGRLASTHCAPFWPPCADWEILIEVHISSQSVFYPILTPSLQVKKILWLVSFFRITTYILIKWTKMLLGLRRVGECTVFILWRAGRIERIFLESWIDGPVGKSAFLCMHKDLSSIPRTHLMLFKSRTLWYTPEATLKRARNRPTGYLPHKPKKICVWCLEPM